MDSNAILYELTNLLNGQGLRQVIERFRNDPSLFQWIGRLMEDERMRVRLATTALLEEFISEPLAMNSLVVPQLIPLLQHPHHLVRGDAANAIALIRGADSIVLLQPLLSDPNEQVKQVVSDILAELEDTIQD